MKITPQFKKRSLITTDKIIFIIQRYIIEYCKIKEATKKNILNLKFARNMEYRYFDVEKSLGIQNIITVFI